MNSLVRDKERFLKYLDSIRGYSALTVASYDESITQMLTTAEIEETEGEIRINLMPLRLRIASQKPKTISRKLSAIRSFVKFLRTEGKGVDLRGDESVKIPQTLPKPVSHDHIVQTLEHADLQARLAITLLYTTGLRISELAHLKVSDVGEHWCRVVGKGNKERDVPMVQGVYAMIRDYHAAAPVREYVFESGGQKLSENSLRYLITRTFEQRGLKVTPHQLRHAYATELLNNRARIADVSELLGHASMATTQIYTRLGNALKMDHYLKSHPLCRNHEDSE